VAEAFTEKPLLTARFDAALRHATRHHARRLRRLCARFGQRRGLAITAMAAERQGHDARELFD
jgi:hypothetical protein